MGVERYLAVARHPCVYTCKVRAPAWHAIDLVVVDSTARSEDELAHARACTSQPRRSAVIRSTQSNRAPSAPAQQALSQRVVAEGGRALCHQQREPFATRHAKAEAGDWLHLFRRLRRAVIQCDMRGDAEEGSFNGAAPPAGPPAGPPASPIAGPTAHLRTAAMGLTGLASCGMPAPGGQEGATKARGHVG